MFEMCEGHAPLNAKQDVLFKRSLFTLSGYIKSYTVLPKTHALQIEGSWTVLHCFFILWN